MLYLIPKPAHRMALRLAHGLRLRWWRIRKPRIAGCRVLAIDLEGRVLLVRHSYGSRNWMAPGGGLARGEDPLAGGQRELREETRCTLQFAMSLDLIEEPLGGAVNDVHIIAGLTCDGPIADGREIVEARFFALDALPESMPPRLRASLPAWVTAAIAARPADVAAAPCLPPAPTG